MDYPKWKYSLDVDGSFRSTLVGNAQAEAELGAAWTDDPHVHGVDVVPYPCELTPAGTLIHHPTRPDANGNHAFGPRPTAPGIGGSVVIGKG